MKKILLGLVVALSFNLAHSKELTNRLGVGFSNQFSEALPSATVRYYPSDKTGVSAALGVDTKDGNSRFGFMAKMYRILFKEDNMNFYIGAGASLLSFEVDDSSDTGFGLSGFGGVEYFLPGLESVGISFEMGVGVVSVSSEVRFRTIADHPFKAGMVFYF